MKHLREVSETLLASPTVQTWLGSLQRHRQLTPQERQDVLQILAAFCAYVGQAPDDIVGRCLRDTGQGKRLHSRSRAYYAAQIEAFQRQSADDLRQQVSCGRVVRGFLVHNGVMLQAGWQYRFPCDKRG